MKHMVFLLLALSAVCIFASQAPACDCQSGGGFYGGGYGYGYLYNNLDYKIPYFAAFPPVYYSHPVARPYGYSPFAYPPGTRTPDIVVAPVEPATVTNPYVEEPASGASKKKDVTEEKVTLAGQPEPLVILNPFVEPTTSLVQVSD